MKDLKLTENFRRHFFSRYSNALLICACLTAMGIWMNLVGYSLAFIPADIASGDMATGFDQTRYSFYGGIIVSCLVFCLLGNRLDVVFNHYLKRWVPFLGILMCLSTFAFANAFSQDFVDPLLAACVACFITGVCYNLFILIFYLRLAETEPMRVAIVCIAASLAAEAALNDIIMAPLYGSAHIVIGMAIPLLCVGAVFLFKIDSPQVEQRECLAGKERGCHIALVFVMSFGSVAIVAAKQTGATAGLWGMRDFWAPPLVQNGVMLAVALVLFALLSWFALVKRTDEGISTRYQIPFLIVIAGCVLSILDGLTPSHDIFPFESVTVDAIEMFTRLLSWTILISAVKTTGISPYRLTGFRGIWFNALSITWIAFLEGNDQRIVSAILLVVFIIVIGITIIPLRIQTVKVDEGKQLEEIADRFNLSAREKEIFILLAKGRNRPYIQKHLVLADGTVKTHTYHIYSKLNVHSKQEMIDLIEREKGR